MILLGTENIIIRDVLTEKFERPLRWIRPLPTLTVLHITSNRRAKQVP